MRCGRDRGRERGAEVGRVLHRRGLRPLAGLSGVARGARAGRDGILSGGEPRGALDRGGRGLRRSRRPRTARATPAPRPPTTARPNPPPRRSAIRENPRDVSRSRETRRLPVELPPSGSPPLESAAQVVEGHRDGLTVRPANEHVGGLALHRQHAPVSRAPAERAARVDIPARASVRCRGAPRASRRKVSGADFLGEPASRDAPAALEGESERAARRLDRARLDLVDPEPVSESANELLRGRRSGGHDDVGGARLRRLRGGGPAAVAVEPERPPVARSASRDPAGRSGSA